MALKVVHIPGKLNTTTHKLSRLEINRDYSPTKNLSIHSGNTKMLYNSKHVCLKKEPIVEEICINDTNQGSGQCQKCSKNRLEKVHIPRVVIFLNSFDSKSYSEVCHRGFKNHFDCPKVEKTSMVDSSGGIHNVSNNTRRRREHSDTRKKHGKKKYVPTTWEIRNPIVNESFEYEKSNIGGAFLQAVRGGKPFKNFLLLEKECQILESINLMVHIH
jgi:hypothetical protein